MCHVPATRTSPSPPAAPMGPAKYNNDEKSLNPDALPFLPALPSSKAHFFPHQHPPLMTWSSPFVYCSVAHHQRPLLYFHDHHHHHHLHPIVPYPPQPQLQQREKENITEAAECGVILPSGKQFQRKQRRPHSTGTFKQKMWAPKIKEEAEPVQLDPNTTTLMIRNIPNRFKRNDMLKILDGHCWVENMEAKIRSDPCCSDPCCSEYDFLYVPMDFCCGANLGYAFVNFTTPIAAVRFAKAYHQHEWKAQMPGNTKTCEISAAAIQGLQALKFHFQNSRFSCHTDSYLPVVLSPPRDGWHCSNPVTVGRRTASCVGATASARRGKLLLMARRRKYH